MERSKRQRLAQPETSLEGGLDNATAVGIASLEQGVQAVAR